MSKSIFYSIVGRSNPAVPSSEKKFYALARSRGDVTLEDMAVQIEKECTVTKADVTAVLVALVTIISNSLADSNIVRLGDLGSFQIGLNGDGSPTEKEFTPTLIKSAHINFRPGVGLRSMLKDLSFSKVEKKAPVAKKDENKENV